MTTFCGGTQSGGPVDRWTPSVAAVTTADRAVRPRRSLWPDDLPGRQQRVRPGRPQGADRSRHRAPRSPACSRTPTPAAARPPARRCRPRSQLFQDKPDRRRHGRTGALRAAGHRWSAHLSQRQRRQRSRRLGSQQDKKFTADALDALRDDGHQDLRRRLRRRARSLRLATSLTEFAQHGGTDHYYPVQDEKSLASAFKSISETVITCAFSSKNDVKDPRLVHVTLDKKDARARHSRRLDHRGQHHHRPGRFVPEASRAARATASTSSWSASPSIYL